MTSFQQIVIALLVAILARSYLPPIGEDSLSNKVFAVTIQFGACAWATVAAVLWVIA